MPLVDAVRRFNRFYTRKIGLLAEHLPASDLSLAEARLLYELAQRDETTAAELARTLDMDKAHVSRILARFRSRGLVRSRPTHGKRLLLALTKRGHETFASVNRGTHERIDGMLRPLKQHERARLVAAMRDIESVFASRDEVPVTLRSPRPGDLGWVTHRQAVLYHKEYGWDWTYEALVARILGDFAHAFDVAREDAWIAEADGTIVGSVFLMKAAEPDVAKLRLLYVEPAARGLGIGAKLVMTCIERARELGYRTLTLWTNDVLVAARRIYQAAGFRLAGEEHHHSFGKDLVGQTWTLDLSGSAAPRATS